MEQSFNSKPDFTDMLIECKDCGRKFVVTGNEQVFFFEKHLDIPKRCLQCRQARREQRGNLRE